ncbi:threonylcarbamoyl-AMP synthase [Candidatus Berkelbacteria bacterium]|nr:threonylcarbamoyl-AMP synthase [Candidatus Berkelbacteria bacterium]
MQTVSVNAEHPDPDILAEAAEIILAGGIVIHPTDTCYGIAVDSTNPRALARLAELKKRPLHPPPSVVVPDIDYLKKICLVDERIEAILDAYLPGPYTFILVNLDQRILSYPSIGIRIPDYRFLLALADRLPVPYTTTSANLTGQPAAYSLAAIEKTLLNSDVVSVLPDLILDAGPLPQRPPSTIVDLRGWPPSIIRQGGRPFVWKMTPSLEKNHKDFLDTERPIQSNEMNYTG